ncbi:hypothetical protein HIM_01971 [Hirsutella minnesotensis 3608]|nr:hypothetical protein HIM_01971 [Hirsutella minnesotensis 3608]
MLEGVFIQSGEKLLSAALDVVEKDIIPLTRQGVSSGSKVFGAAILSRADLRPLTVATNNERISPLLHGEVNCIQKFFTVDYPETSSRPSPRNDCIFFATHEPCSLCLSAIAWSGFREFYYLFTYEDSRDIFNIPHDIHILEQVFRVRGHETDEQVQSRPLYNHSNQVFEGRSLNDVAADIGNKEIRDKWLAEMERVKGLYMSLNHIYQEAKTSHAETSSIWT